MKYAIIENKVVDNIVVASYPAESNWMEIPTDLPVHIGDSYDTMHYYDSDGNIRRTPSDRVICSRINELENEKILLNAQIKALSDRNDFLEDCMAEMAGIIYA